MKHARGLLVFGVAMALTLASAAIGWRAMAEDGEGEPLDYAILAMNTYDSTLEFVGLERFPDMKLDPRLQAPGIEAPERRVLSDAAEWRSFWERANPELVAKVSALSIDFESDVVVVAAAGVRQGPDEQTIIVDLLEFPDAIQVQVAETDGSCSADGAPSHPLAVVRAPRSSKPIRFEMQPMPCSG